MNGFAKIEILPRHLGRLAETMRDLLVPNEWVVKSTHLTLDFTGKRYAEEGRATSLKATHYCVDLDQGVAALKVQCTTNGLVKDFLCPDGRTAHITLAVRAGVKPKVSNNIKAKDWIKLSDNLHLEGVVKFELFES